MQSDTQPSAGLRKAAISYNKMQINCKQIAIYTESITINGKQVAIYVDVNCSKLQIILSKLQYIITVIFFCDKMTPPQNSVWDPNHGLQNMVC